MTPLGPRKVRRGVSLAELLVAMSGGSVVIAGATALVHRTLALESSSRRVIARERAALALARRFRADVHESVVADCGPEASGGSVVLRLKTADDRSIRYEATERDLARIERDEAGVVRREHWRFEEEVAWSAIRNRELVSLVATAGPARSALAFEAIAVLGSRRALRAGARP